MGFGTSLIVNQMKRGSLLFLIIVLSTIVTFNSCGPKVEYKLIESYRLPEYTQGETLIYQSGNNYDTFVYIEKKVTYINIDENWRQQIIWYTLQNKKDTGLYCGINLDLNGSWISWQNKLMMFMSPDKLPDTTSITLNGKLYHDVYYNEKPLTDTAKIYPTKIYFSYKKWIIRYIMNDSTTWDLIQH